MNLSSSNRPRYVQQTISGWGMKKSLQKAEGKVKVKDSVRSEYIHQDECCDFIASTIRRSSF